MKKIYLDYAAATPMSTDVLVAMQPYFSEVFYNPSALYLDGQAAKKALQDARRDVAQTLGCKPSEIIFTAGGTESDNLAIQGVMQAYPGKTCVVSSVEHDAVLEPARQYEYKLATVQPDGRVDLGKLADMIDDNTVLVSIMYANNEIGTIQPLHNIAKLIKTIRETRKKSGNTLPLYLHTDACQAANYLPLLVSSLGVDLMTLNGGKIYGPKQSGILYVKTGVNLHPQIRGGGQERGIRSGTENVAAAVGFATALEQASRMREAEQARLHDLQTQCVGLLEAKLPNVSINGSLKHRLANNVHLTIANTDNERVMMELDERGIMVATGSACSASSDEPSHVLTAIGLDEAAARSSLRISFGRQTTAQDIELFVDTLATVVAPDAN